MLDRMKMAWAALALYGGVALLGALGFLTPALNAAIFTTQLLLVSLACCVKPASKPQIDDRILKQYSVSPEFAKFMSNPDFHKTISFVYSMSPDEFMMFCRAVAEMRYTADQFGLRDVANARRKHEENGGDRG